LAVGAGVFSVSEAASCVTNASLKVDVGVTGSTVLIISGLIVLGVVVAMIVGAGEAVGGTPPKGVGVTYWPHKEAFPAQDASKNEAAIKKLISRFTK
jgi:hypothetical protein